MTKGVPYGDAFSIDITMKVESDPNDETACSVRSSFAFRWLKVRTVLNLQSVFIKGLIEKQASAGIREFYGLWLSMAKSR